MFRIVPHVKHVISAPAHVKWKNATATQPPLSFPLRPSSLVAHHYQCRSAHCLPPDQSGAEFSSFSCLFLSLGITPRGPPRRTAVQTRNSISSRGYRDAESKTTSFSSGRKVTTPIDASDILKARQLMSVSAAVKWGPWLCPNSRDL